MLKLIYTLKVGFFLLALLYGSFVSGAISETKVFATHNELCDLSNRKNAALSILNTYKASYDLLTRYNQTHLTLRNYRTSGELIGRNILSLNLYKLNEKLNETYTQFSSQYVFTKANAAFDSIQIMTNTDLFRQERGKRQKESIKNYKEYLYYRGLLYPLVTLKDFGLVFKHQDSLLKILKSYPFETILTNKEIIKVWGAQTANDTYWLAELGVINIIEKYRQLFHEVYDDKFDETLDNYSYTNKLYGLTHILINESRFYQQWIDYDKNQKIYRYFEKNIDTIISRAKPDVLAEIGVTFLLARQENNPVVTKLRKVILNNIDKKRCYILGGNAPDLQDAEHRNILAIILLRGIDKLYPGPTISELKKE